MTDNDNIKSQPEKWLYPLIIDYQRRKVCSCRNRHFVLDTVNRLVFCKECNAIIDPFEALYQLARDADNLNRSKEVWTKEAEKERQKCFKYRGVNNISKNYREGLVPICPRCKKPLDPADIDHYVSRIFLSGEAKDEEKTE